MFNYYFKYYIHYFNSNNADVISYILYSCIAASMKLVGLRPTQMMAAYALLMELQKDQYTLIKNLLAFYY